MMNTKEKILVAALRLYINIIKTKEIFLTVYLNTFADWMWNALEKAASRNRIIRICRRLFPMYPQKV